VLQTDPPQCVSDFVSVLRKIDELCSGLFVSQEFRIHVAIVYVTRSWSCCPQIFVRCCRVISISLSPHSWERPAPDLITAHCVSSHASLLGLFLKHLKKSCVAVGPSPSAPTKLTLWLTLSSMCEVSLWSCRLTYRSWFSCASLGL
jgi:hypothetical protein